MSKKKNGAVVALSIVAFLGLAGVGVSFLSNGFQNWNLEDWKNHFIIPSTSDPTDTSSDSTPEPEPSGLGLNITAYNAAAIGDTFGLEATVSPSNASDKRVTWETSDLAKISIASSQNTATGGSAIFEVEAAFDGVVTITATTVDGGHEATCEVRYTVMVETIAIVPVVEQAQTPFDLFCYYNGSSYFVNDYADHDEAFRVNVQVSPYNADIVASKASVLAASGWLTSTNNVFSKHPINSSVIYGEIAYDAVNDIATIPLVLRADFSTYTSSTLSITLDGILSTQLFSLYIGTTGIGVDQGNVIL